jgi:hypothetical protein
MLVLDLIAVPFEQIQGLDPPGAEVVGGDHAVDRRWFAHGFVLLVVQFKKWE